MILDGTNLGIWDWNLATNHVSYDRRWAQMLGLSVEEIGMDFSTWETRVHPEDLLRCKEDIRVYLEGRTARYENVRRFRYKNVHWIYLLAKAMCSERDADGRPTRFTGTHLDVIEFKTLE